MPFPVPDAKAPIRKTLGANTISNPEAVSL
jgi:hypothetical protein